MDELISQIQALPRRDIYGDAYLRFDDVIAVLAGRAAPEPPELPADEPAPAADEEPEA